MAFRLLFFSSIYLVLFLMVYYTSKGFSVILEIDLFLFKKKMVFLFRCLLSDVQTFVTDCGLLRTKYTALS